MFGDKLVELFDLNGRKVMSKKISGEILDITNLEAGFLCGSNYN